MYSMTAHEALSDIQNTECLFPKPSVTIGFDLAIFPITLVK